MTGYLVCWWCGGAPVRQWDIGTFGDPERQFLEWERADHDHAVLPPSPGELLARGSAHFDRILAILAE